MKTIMKVLRVAGALAVAAGALGAAPAVAEQCRFCDKAISPLHSFATTDPIGWPAGHTAQATAVLVPPPGTAVPRDACAVRLALLDGAGGTLDQTDDEPALPGVIVFLDRTNESNDRRLVRAELLVRCRDNRLLKHIVGGLEVFDPSDGRSAGKTTYQCPFCERASSTIHSLQ